MIFIDDQSELQVVAGPTTFPRRTIEFRENCGWGFILV